MNQLFINQNFFNNSRKIQEFSIFLARKANLNLNLYRKLDFSTRSSNKNYPVNDEANVLHSEDLAKKHKISILNHKIDGNEFSYIKKNGSSKFENTFIFQLQKRSLIQHLADNEIAKFIGVSKMTTILIPENNKKLHFKNSLVISKKEINSELFYNEKMEKLLNILECEVDYLWINDDTNKNLEGLDEELIYDSMFDYEDILIGRKLIESTELISKINYQIKSKNYDVLFFVDFVDKSMYSIFKKMKLLMLAAQNNIAIIFISIE